MKQKSAGNTDVVSCKHSFVELLVNDMALITFDTYPFSVYTDPQMTVVDINMYEMGQEVGRLVIQKLKHPKRQIQTFTALRILLQEVPFTV